MPDSDTDPPSHYHLLQRLLSLVYTSPPRTSSFYAQVLFDLYNYDLMKGVEVEVVIGHNNLEDESKQNPIPITETLKLPRHLALHIMAYNHLNLNEPYSAIQLVKEHIERAFKLTQDEWEWNAITGKVSKKKMEEEEIKVKVEEGLSEDEEESERIERAKKAKAKAEALSSKLPSAPTHLPCLECAMIHSKACMELSRYEEGRLVLERTLKTLEKILGKDSEEYRKRGFSFIP